MCLGAQPSECAPVAPVAEFVHFVQRPCNADCRPSNTWHCHKAPQRPPVCQRVDAVFPPSSADGTRHGQVSGPQGVEYAVDHKARQVMDRRLRIVACAVHCRRACGCARSALRHVKFAQLFQV